MPWNEKEERAEIENIVPRQPPLRSGAAGLTELEKTPVSSAEAERMLLAEETVDT